jgi:MFS superfamily sulfate permease-like transporter
MAEEHGIRIDATTFVTGHASTITMIQLPKELGHISSEGEVTWYEGVSPRDIMGHTLMDPMMKIAVLGLWYGTNAI